VTERESGDQATFYPEKEKMKEIGKKDGNEQYRQGLLRAVCGCGV
jgi:general stress protein YciG